MGVYPRLSLIDTKKSLDQRKGQTFWTEKRSQTLVCISLSLVSLSFFTRGWGYVQVFSGPKGETGYGLDCAQPLVLNNGAPIISWAGSIMSVYL